VALWFACRSQPGKDGVLTGFQLGENAVHLDTATIRHSIDDLLGMACGRLLWWQPRSLSPRISAQQAVFVFGQVVDEPGIDPAGRGRARPRRHRRDPRRRDDLRLGATEDGNEQALGADAGLSEESLFPDFDGFAPAHSVDKPFPAEFIMKTPNS
jgi:hypothetical protein